MYFLSTLVCCEEVISKVIWGRSSAANSQGYSACLTTTLSTTNVLSRKLSKSFRDARIPFLSFAHFRNSIRNKLPLIPNSDRLFSIQTTRYSMHK